MRRTALLALPALFLLALTIALPAAGATEVYRWKDANGTVHFADAPPPEGVKYQIVNLATGSERDPTPPPAATVTPPPAPADSTPEKPMADTPENRAKLCQILKERVALYESDARLTEPGDSSKVIGAEKRATQLADFKAKQQQYCTPTKPGA